MSLPEVGQFIVLQVPAGMYKGYYHCQIQETNSKLVVLDIPIQMDSSLPETLPEGTQIIVHYTDKTQTPCEFDSRVEGQLFRKTPLLMIQRPEARQVRRKQRREHVRVPASIPVEVVAMDLETRRFFKIDSMSKDISGGGLSIIVRKNEPLRVGDYIGLRFEIVLDSKPHDIVVKARIVNVKPVDDVLSKKICALKFLDLKPSEQQVIIQYVFKRQIELRERGWLRSRI